MMNSARTTGANLGHGNVEHTLGLLRNPKTRLAALDALDHLPDTAVPAVLAVLLPVPDTMVQAALVAYLRSRRSAIETLLEIARSPDHDLGLRAVRMLGSIGTQDAFLALRQLCVRSHRDVRLGAVAELAARHSSVANSDLRSMLDEADWEIRCAALSALGVVGDATYWVDVSLLLEDPHVVVRRVALETVGRLGPARAAPCIVRFLSDRDSICRTRAFVALLHITSRDVSTLAILAALGREYAEVISSVADSIGADADDALQAMESRIDERDYSEASQVFNDAFGNEWVLELADRVESGSLWAYDLLEECLGSEWALPDAPSGNPAFLARLVSDYSRDLSSSGGRP